MNPLKKHHLSTLAFSLLVLTGTARAATWSHPVLTDNTWLTDSNWINPATAPNGVGAQAYIERELMLTIPASGDNIFDVVAGNTVTVGQIAIESANNFTPNFSNGTIVFDNGGANAIWNVETAGTPKHYITVKGSSGWVLSDNLVITSQSQQQFRPGGTLKDATGESHSVTYSTGGILSGGNYGFKLNWTATNTGGTIVDSGQIRFTVANGDAYIGQAASGADIVLKNGGMIWNEEANHTLSRTIEVGSGGGAFYTLGAGKSLLFSGKISGSGQLTIKKKNVTGLGTVTLTGTTGVNTLTGNVVLDNLAAAAGWEMIVVADKVGAFGQTPLLTVDDYVTLQITANAGTGKGAIDDDVTEVQLKNTNTFIEVASGVNEKVGAGKLKRYNGTTYDTIAAGTYSSSNSSWVTGLGTVTVLSADSGYASWKSNAGGQDPSLDWDNDGVSNGVEYFMDAAAGFTASPALDGSNDITWHNGGKILPTAYGPSPTGQYVVQTSNDLKTWSDVDAANLISNTASTLTYHLEGTGPRFVRLVVTPQ